jgi:hypothetical protein
MSTLAIRADFLHCLRDPGLDGSDLAAVEHICDDILLMLGKSMRNRRLDLLPRHAAGQHRQRMPSSQGGSKPGPKRSASRRA